MEWARTMTGWGSVLAIEAQERIYYALVGIVKRRPSAEAEFIGQPVDYAGRSLVSLCAINIDSLGRRGSIS